MTIGASPLEELLSAQSAALPNRSSRALSRSRELIEQSCELLEQISEGRDTTLFLHSANTALCVAQIGLSDELVCLALLHHATPHQLSGARGGHVQRLRQKLRALRSLREPAMSVGQFSGGGALEYGNAVVAEALKNDPDLILIIFASALDALTALGQGTQPPDFELRLSEDPKAFAEDVLDYLAPLAHFYHLVDLAWRIEDAVFAIRDPESYRRIIGTLRTDATLAQRMINELKRRLQARLESVFEGRSAFRLQGRTKGIFSIARKLGFPEDAPANVSDLGDLIALRVVIENHKGLFGKDGKGDLGRASLSEEEKVYRACVQVAETVGAEFGLSVGRADDYLHYPTPTGYQAFHIGIPLPEGLRDDLRLPDSIRNIEIQIRTKELHEKAEFGEWAHFKYRLKAARGELSERGGPRDAKREWNEGWADHFSSRVAFRTDGGCLREIARGATYADAAYMLLEAGEHPREVQIQNSEFSERRDYHDLFEPMIPLSRITVKKKGEPGSAPSPASIGRLQTAEARQAVSKLFESSAPRGYKSDYLRSLSDQGGLILLREVDLTHQWSYSLDPTEATTKDALSLAGRLRASKRPFPSRDDLFVSVAKGAIDSRRLLTLWRTEFDKRVEVAYKLDQRRREAYWSSATGDATPLSVGRVHIVPYRHLAATGSQLKQSIIRANCCGPLPGDLIVGWNFAVPDNLRRLTPEAEISIVHRADCPAAKAKPSKELVIRGDTWPQLMYRARSAGQVEFSVYDRPRLLNRITAAIAQICPEASFGDIISRKIYDASAFIWLEVSVLSITELNDIMLGVKKLLADHISEASRAWRPIQDLREEETTPGGGTE